MNMNWNSANIQILSYMTNSELAECSNSESSQTQEADDGSLPDVRYLDKFLNFFRSRSPVFVSDLLRNVEAQLYLELVNPIKRFHALDVIIDRACCKTLILQCVHEVLDLLNVGRNNLRQKLPRSVEAFPDQLIRRLLYPSAISMDPEGVLVEGSWTALLAFQEPS